MGESGVPVSFVDQQFLSHPDNSEVARALEGVEVRGPHTGHEGWATVYTPVGYTLRADNILATIRSRVADTAASCTNVRLYENHAVTSIDRAARTVRVEDRYSSSPQQLQLEYDQLVLAAGPW